MKINMIINIELNESSQSRHIYGTITRIFNVFCNVLEHFMHIFFSQKPPNAPLPVTQAPHFGFLYFPQFYFNNRTQCLGS